MTERVSRLGVYAGFHPQVADGYERETLYVPVGVAAGSDAEDPGFAFRHAEDPPLQGR